MTKYPTQIENHLETPNPIQLNNPWVIWGASEHLKDEFTFDPERRQKVLYPLYRFSTIQGFYHAYQLALETMARFVIMREGTEPIWEDISHIYGAHWTVTFGLTRVDYLEKLLDCVLSMLGETFTNELYDSTKITGVTIINTPQLHQFRFWLNDDREKLTIQHLSEEYKELFGWETRQDVSFVFSPFRRLAMKEPGPPSQETQRDSSEGWSAVKSRHNTRYNRNQRY